MKRGFNPFLFGDGVRELVTRKCQTGIERRYKRAPSSDPKNIGRSFRTSNYYMGTAVADTLGCNLRCIFCWTRNRFRNHSTISRVGNLYSSSEVANHLLSNLKAEKLRYMRMTEGEPTLDTDHFLGVLDCLYKSHKNFTFIFETNGLILGKNQNLAKRLAEYKNKNSKTPFLHARVSIKGATPQKFRLLTFADANFHKFQFTAIKNCLDQGLSVHPAVMLDFIDSKEEIEYLRNQLQDIDAGLVKSLEFERLFLERYVIKRLKKYHIPFKNVYTEVEKSWQKQQ